MGSHTAFVKEKREYVETDDMETMALQDELISLEDKISVIRRKKNTGSRWKIKQTGQEKQRQ